MLFSASAQRDSLPFAACSSRPPPVPSFNPSRLCQSSRQVGACDCERAGWKAADCALAAACSHECDGAEVWMDGFEMACLPAWCSNFCLPEIEVLVPGERVQALPMSVITAAPKLVVGPVRDPDQ
jgi:hypothetical protein